MAKLQITPIDPRMVNPVSFILDSEQKLTFIIGRDIGNANADHLDIVISDRTVSKEHALLEADPSPGGVNWYLTDTSLNGTKVNGVKLPKDKPVRLSGFGDEVLCGMNECGFVVDSAVTDPGIDLSRPPDEPTINKTGGTAATKPIIEPLAHGRTWADVVALVLTGPPEAPSWFVLMLWGLLVAGGIHLAATWIRSQ